MLRTEVCELLRVVGATVLSSARRETTESLRLGVGTHTGGSGGTPKFAAGTFRVLACGVNVEAVSGLHSTTRGVTGGGLCNRKSTAGGGVCPLGVLIGERVVNHGDCRHTTFLAEPTEAIELVSPEVLPELLSHGVVTEVKDEFA